MSQRIILSGVRSPISQEDLPTIPNSRNNGPTLLDKVRMSFSEAELIHGLLLRIPEEAFGSTGMELGLTTEELIGWGGQTKTKTLNLVVAYLFRWASKDDYTLAISPTTHKYEDLTRALVSVVSRLDCKGQNFGFSTIRVMLSKQRYQLSKFAGPCLVGTLGDKLSGRAT